MGKGDKKTRRGKINAGSYGKKRPHHVAKKFVAKASQQKAPPAPAKTQAEESKPKITIVKARPQPSQETGS